MAVGVLKTNGVHLQPHEYHTVKVLLERGYDVELVPTPTIKHLQSPDIIMEGLPWEIKAPEGSSKNTIKHNFQNAAHQAQNVIFDLGRCKLDERIALNELRYHYSKSKRIKYLKVVKKSEEIIDISKNIGVN